MMTITPNIDDLTTRQQIQLVQFLLDRVQSNREFSVCFDVARKLSEFSPPVEALTKIGLLGMAISTLTIAKDKEMEKDPDIPF
jgi:hypothetical protein